MTANKINLKISVDGKSNKESRNPMSLQEAKKLVCNKKYPKDIEDALIKTLTKMPKDSYERFFKNFYVHLNRIQQAKKDEQN